MKVKSVRVDVMDVTVGAGWWNYDEKGHGKQQKTIPFTGFLVDKNKDFVILASGYNHAAKDWCNEVTIPASIVKRIKVLETLEV